MRSRILPPDESSLLRPDSVAKRRLPINIRQQDMALFSHELERKIPGTKLLEMRDVRVSPEGILFKRGQIAIESFAFPWMWDEWRQDKVLRFVAHNYIFRKHSQLEEDALLVIDNWSHGYFHWLADALSRLYAVRALVSDLVLLLPEQYKETQFIRASLEPFKLGGIRFIAANEVVSCRRLLLPTHTAPSGHYNEEIIQGLRDLLVSAYGGKRGSETGGRIYLSRGRSSRRTIVNEKEVVGVLREFGFHILCAEELSFAEQVSVFSATRCLVSNHGAGLMNMLFMSPGSKVFELRHQTDNVNNCYFTLASALGLNYFYQTCQPDQPDQDPHFASIKVDVRSFRDNLELLVSCL